MNMARGGRNRGNDDSQENKLQNKRLAEIREAYECHKMTPRQEQEKQEEARRGLINGMRSSGVSESMIALFEGDLRAADSYSKVGDVPNDDPRDKIVTKTFAYNNGRGIVAYVTISSEGSRHWRNATIHDSGSIVYLLEGNEFGEFDDTGYETDEEFPDTKHSTAIVCTFSGNRESPWAIDGRFEQLLMVPEEVLQGVKNEAPPGKLFSGKSLTNHHERSTWSPAPKGLTWLHHPFLKNTNGMYLSHEQAFYMNKIIQVPGMKPEMMEKVWKERGALEYWCPVLKRFLSDGERLREEHWFHNGDGTAQQRYFYTQMEMLDLHGGLENLPANMDSIDDEICFVGVMGYEEIISERIKRAEKKGEVIEIDQDSKMPVKRQRNR